MRTQKCQSLNRFIITIMIIWYLNPYNSIHLCQINITYWQIKVTKKWTETSWTEISCYWPKCPGPTRPNGVVTLIKLTFKPIFKSPNVIVPMTQKWSIFAAPSNHASNHLQTTLQTKNSKNVTHRLDFAKVWCWFEASLKVAWRWFNRIKLLIGAITLSGLKFGLKVRLITIDTS